MTGPSNTQCLGAGITPEALALDPYPIYARLQASEPICWLPALNMYYVVRYHDVQALLNDTARFAVGTEQSTLFDTFGAHMLTVDAERHDLYRKEFAPSMSPSALRGGLESAIVGHVHALIDGFEPQGRIDLRSAFAARLPILTMLSLFGIPLERERDVRRWYDSFEAALANFQWHDAVRQAARRNVVEFREMIRDSAARHARTPDSHALLSRLVHSDTRLQDAELEQNALIVFFGGISTVEALILNTLYALHVHPPALATLRADGNVIGAVLDETIRWSGPVQSATRHVVRDTSFGGVALREGDTVNCMIAAANRDPEKFPAPERFDIARSGLRHHLGFAAGPHHCLGAHLAKLEARLAIQLLTSRLPNWRIDPHIDCAPYGSEFRKPRQLPLLWD